MVLGEKVAVLSDIKCHFVNLVSFAKKSHDFFLSLFFTDS